MEKKFGEEFPKEEEIFTDDQKQKTEDERAESVDDLIKGGARLEVTEQQINDARNEMKLERDTENETEEIKDSDLKLRDDIRSLEAGDDIIIHCKDIDGNGASSILGTVTHNPLEMIHGTYLSFINSDGVLDRIDLKFIEKVETKIRARIKACKFIKKRFEELGIEVFDEIKIYYKDGKKAKVKVVMVPEVNSVRFLALEEATGATVGIEMDLLTDVKKL